MHFARLDFPKMAQEGVFRLFAHQWGLKLLGSRKSAGLVVHVGAVDAPCDAHHQHISLVLAKKKEVAWLSF